MLEAQAGTTGVEVWPGGPPTLHASPPPLPVASGQPEPADRQPQPVQRMPTLVCPQSLKLAARRPLPQLNGKNPVTNLLDNAAALNLTMLRVFATGVTPELPLQVEEGELGCCRGQGCGKGGGGRLRPRIASSVLELCLPHTLALFSPRPRRHLQPGGAQGAGPGGR